jgi:hypothetical protein
MNANAPQTPWGTIHRTIRILLDALEELGASMPLFEAERLSIMINRAMTAEARSFHTPEHVFDLIDPGNPIANLAALFHDLVYYNVDRGFIPSIASAVEPGIEACDEGLRIKAGAPGADRALALCLAVFGFEAGQCLPPQGGMNEFLSALVMNRSLAPYVREEDLVLVTACIEATIPFRKTEANGMTPALRLRERLGRMRSAVALSLPDERIRLGVGWAVTLANRDVANFSDAEVGRFLDNTWKLLPETNPSLRTQGVYSIKSYRMALQGMEGFLGALDPSTIYARYDGNPSETEYERMTRQAARNVETATRYLQIKLLTASILEALAYLSGGDAPVALFMGDLGSIRVGSQLADYLPDIPASREAPFDTVLHDLLAKGRTSASAFDLQNSPLSRFVYLHLGTGGIEKPLEAARRMFVQDISPGEFLDVIPAELAAAVAESCAHMAFTRADALRAYAESRRT